MCALVRKTKKPEKEIRRPVSWQSSVGDSAFAHGNSGFPQIAVSYQKEIIARADITHNTYGQFPRISHGGR